MAHRFPRSKRVADSMKRETAAILMHDVKEPGIQGLVTVMGVEISNDLRHAKIFVSVMGNEQERASALAGLDKATGFIRRILGSRMDLKHMPEIRFHLDRSIEDQEKIARLIGQTRRAEQAES